MKSFEVNVRQIIDNRVANAIRAKKGAITNVYCKRGYWLMQDSLVEHNGKQYIICPGGLQKNGSLCLYDYVFENVGEKITDFENFEKTNTSCDYLESILPDHDRPEIKVLVGTITFEER